MKSAQPNSELLRYLRRIDVGAFLRWWGLGLRACLPAALRRLFAESRQRLLVEVSDGRMVLLQEDDGEARERGRYLLGGVDDGSRAEIQALVGKARQVVLRLPTDKVLSKTIPLPLAAEPNMRQVVGFEIDRLTPFSSAQVYYDAQVLARQPAARRMQVRFTAAPRPVVDTLVKRLSEMGLTPDTVCACGDAEGINLLTPERRPRKSALTQRLNAALSLMAVVLIVVAGSLPVWQQRNLVIDLLPRVAAAQREAEAILGLRKELDDSIGSSQFLLEKKHQSPPLMDVLSELTAVLPDDTWVENLDIKGAEVQVRGQSLEASKLIGLMEASALFHDATFRSPVTADRRTGRDRFHLAAKISREP